MKRINEKAVKMMSEKEKFFAEITFLDLAYTYENEEYASGSYAMRRSAESVCLYGESRADRKLRSSWKDIFDLSKSIRERTGESLIGFVEKEDKTPKNALNVWRQIYRAIDDERRAVDGGSK